MSAVKSGGLLDQYKLLGAIIDAEWATCLDHKVARHIIDRYYPTHGNGRASLRYLQQATGATRTNIVASTRRLVENGVINVVRQGIGTRPTEYGLNLNFSAKVSSGPVGETSTSGPVHETTTGPVDETSSAASGPVGDTESYLRCRSTDRHTENRINDVPAARPLGGLAPAPALAAEAPKKARDSFDELWAAFPRKHHRSKARAEYEKLAPNAEMHKRLVESATAWAAHYQATGTEQKWRKHLHTWLADERYLEDLPEPYENAKGAAIAKTKERGPKISTESETGSVDLSPQPPTGRHVVEIVGSDLVDDAVTTVSLHCRIRDGKHDGKEFTHKIVLFDNEGYQDEGHRYFNAICKAVRIEPNDTSELHGAVLCAAVTNGGRIQYYQK